MAFLLTSFFSFNIVKISCHSLLAYNVSPEKSYVRWIETFVGTICLFSCCFKNPPFLFNLGEHNYNILWYWGGANPEDLSRDIGLETGAVGFCPTLGLTGPLLSYKANSCAQFPILPLSWWSSILLYTAWDWGRSNERNPLTTKAFKNWFTLEFHSHRDPNSLRIVPQAYIKGDSNAGQSTSPFHQGSSL